MRGFGLEPEGLTGKEYMVPGEAGELGRSLIL